MVEVGPSGEGFVATVHEASEPEPYTSFPVVVPEVAAPPMNNFPSNAVIQRGSILAASSAVFLAQPSVEGSYFHSSPSLPEVGSPRT
jgi:hypothetical protein